MTHFREMILICFPQALTLPPTTDSQEAMQGALGSKRSSSSGLALCTWEALLGWLTPPVSLSTVLSPLGRVWYSQCLRKLILS